MPVARTLHADAGRFVNQDPIGLEGGDNLYWFAPNVKKWVDPLGLDPFAKAIQSGAHNEQEKLSKEHKYLNLPKKLRLEEPPLKKEITFT